MHQAHCISEGKSVHWNSKRMNGTNCEHTEPFNLEMYMGRLKSNVVFSELKASTCIFPMALASIPDVKFSLCSATDFHVFEVHTSELGRMFCQIAHICGASFVRISASTRSTF